MPPQALAGSAYARTAKDLDENMQLLGLDQVAKPKPKPKRNPKPNPNPNPKPNLTKGEWFRSGTEVTLIGGAAACVAFYTAKGVDYLVAKSGALS